MSPVDALPVLPRRSFLYSMIGRCEKLHVECLDCYRGDCCNSESSIWKLLTRVSKRSCPCPQWLGGTKKSPRVLTKDLLGQPVANLSVLLWVPNILTNTTVATHTIRLIYIGAKLFHFVKYLKVELIWHWKIEWWNQKNSMPAWLPN